MFNIAVIVLRAAQALATMIDIGLAAYVTYLGLMPPEPCLSNPSATSSVPSNCSASGWGLYSSVGIFVLVKCAWTLLTLVVLSLVPLCMSVPPFLITTLDGLAMLLWLAGAIALAVLVAGADALSDIITVFEFIILALFVATFAMSLTSLFRRVRSMVNRKSTSESSRGPRDTLGARTPEYMASSRNNLGFVSV